MARGKGRAAGRRRGEEPPVSDLYRDMVREAVVAQSSSAAESGERPLKRRKKGASTATEDTDAMDKEKATVQEPDGTEAEVQIDVVDTGVEDAPFSDQDSDESDADWEEVDLAAHSISLTNLTNLDHAPAKAESLDLVFEGAGKGKGLANRRSITAVERRIRMEVHKLHVLCLMYHVYRRSRWCNSSVVKANLRRLVPQKVTNHLNRDPSDQQFRRHKLFLEGLQSAMDMWRKKYHVIRKGLSQPYWSDDPENLENTLPRNTGDPPMKKSDFLSASETLAGSRDLGAQLFCALLRSVGVTCRLVCSLQVLPLSFSGNSRKAGGAIDEGIPDRHSSVDSDIEDELDVIFSSTARIEDDSAFPVYWVEAWSVANQKWIAVDPHATATVGKPSKIEPPVSDVYNTMSYVIGFEEEGHASDVTRRYANRYNGKTRRLRVTSVKGGQQWWDKILRLYYRGYDLDRDQVEDAELAQREVSEPIPNSINDLKDHPHFALKRHLRKNEVLLKERKVGSITTGTGKKKVTEPIFRRQDVTIVKTSQQWYRLGREVIPTETPLKFAAPRKRVSRGRGMSEEPIEEPDIDNRMFSEAQTTLYIPPPVEYGMVPKNRYGNLDVYVPSMIPAGGVHISYQTALAVRAARLLGIDYAEAVTGFDFRNRQAAAVTSGIVVAREYEEAVRAVLEGFEYEATEEEQRQKSAAALRLWRLFLQKLRIRERVQKMMGPVEDKGEESPQPDSRGGGGGFISEKEGAPEKEKKTEPENVGEKGEELGGGFVSEEPTEGGGFLPEQIDNDEDQDMILPDVGEAEDEDPDLDNEEYDWY